MAVAKTLSDRIAQLLPEMISHNQTAFIKGGSIADNTALAEEHLCGFNQQATQVCVYVNIQKAFNSILTGQPLWNP